MSLFLSLSFSVIHTSCRLDKRPSIQLITVGPVIDLYGRFAAEKLNRLMELYPDRVYSKPEFTALPPYLFSGADFALIPSRDEPFGLVAVEFGRKGALGVGSRLGGLGLMPGWVRYSYLHAVTHLDIDPSQWFPVESMSTGHLMSQLSKTVKLALKSTEEERAILRARSAVQRFPVVEWRQRMEDFHKRSIHASRGLAGHDAWRPSDGATGGLTAIAEHDDWNPVHQADPSQPDWDAQSAQNSPRTHVPGSPGQWSQETLTPGGDPFLHAPPRIQDVNRISTASNASDNESDYHSPSHSGSRQPEFGNFLDKANRTIARDQKHAPDPFLEAPSRPFGAHSRVSSVESIASIVDEKANSPLNKAIASVSRVYFAPLCITYGVCSLPMRTGALLMNSLRSYKTCLQITRRESCPSRNSSPRAKKPSLTRFGKTSFPVRQVIDRHGASRFGERLHPPFTITHHVQHVRLFRLTCINPLMPS